MDFTVNAHGSTKIPVSRKFPVERILLLENWKLEISYNYQALRGRILRFDKTLNYIQKGSTRIHNIAHVLYSHVFIHMTHIVYDCSEGALNNFFVILSLLSHVASDVVVFFYSKTNMPVISNTGSIIFFYWAALILNSLCVLHFTKFRITL